MPRTISGDQSQAVPSSKALGAVAAAKHAIGVPYVWGGTNLKLGVDCSGLCWAAYRTQNVQLPRTSQEQFKAGTKVPKGKEIPGDLVFSYPDEGGVPGPGHVVMAIGNGKCVTAPFTGALVRIDDLSHFDSVYVGSRRIVPAAAGGSNSGGNTSGGSGVSANLSNAIGSLTDTHTYYRIGQVLMGLALLVAGLLIIIKISPLKIAKNSLGK